MRIAIVHDWLLTYAGAERVLEQLFQIYPEADLFSVVDFIPDGKRDFIHNKKVKTTFIQNLPAAKRYYRHYLPLMPIAIEQLDLSGYDLVISSSHAVAKGALTGPNQLHICYCHSPMRYAWDLQHQYLAEAGLHKGVKSLLARTMLHYMRLWDYRTANGVDQFVANSKFIAQRIRKTYGREATVLYPPVDTDYFNSGGKKENFYLTASRMVPYKKMPLIVEAFTQMPEKQLIVIGDGPEERACKRVAGSNVTFLGWQPTDVLKDHYQGAKAFVFAAEEDFGIAPVEAQACGTAVIAFGKGGVLETIIAPPAEKPTGLFFYEQTTAAIKGAVSQFESMEQQFRPEHCRENALRFNPARFRDEFSVFCRAAIAAHTQ